MQKNKENNGMEEIGLVTPTPGLHPLPLIWPLWGIQAVGVRGSLYWQGS